MYDQSDLKTPWGLLNPAEILKQPWPLHGGGLSGGKLGTEGAWPPSLGEKPETLEEEERMMRDFYYGDMLERTLRMLVPESQRDR